MNAPVEKLDALFVIHQDADLEKIRCIIKKRGFRQIFVLTTHHLLGKEQQAIANLAIGVRTATLASLLTDAEMASCDQKATDELLPRLSDRSIQRRYLGHFIDRSLWHKSALVCKKLNSTKRFGDIYFSPGLGVYSPLWAQMGGKSILPPFSRFNQLTVPLYRRKIYNILKKRHIFSICHDRTCYFFVSTLARLKFSKNISTRKTRIFRLRWLLITVVGNSSSRLLRNLARNQTPAGHRPILCATIHDYVHTIGESGLPLLIFVDGHHPSNYPRSYLDMYAHGRFVVRDVIGETWFKKHGKESLKPPPFMTSARMLPVEMKTVCSVKHILLALNHAGDWTALINRSDTDLLLEAFSRMARLFPETHFTVRPHPTMATSEHEGKNSLNRIKIFIRERALTNLAVSQNALSTDLQNTQLILSEYSQVLIDAYHTGNLGLVVNLTGRRSFMKDYEDAGFPAVYSDVELAAWIKELMENPEKAVLCQNQAVKNFNQRLLAAGYH